MESSRPYPINVNFKIGIDFVPGSSLPPPENQFHGGIDTSQGIDSVESMPGVLNSLKIRDPWIQAP